MFIVIMATSTKQACVRTCGFIYLYNEIHTYINKYNLITWVTPSSCSTRETKDQVGVALLMALLSPPRNLYKLLVKSIQNVDIPYVDYY